VGQCGVLLPGVTVSLEDLDVSAEQANCGDRAALDNVLSTLRPVIERYCRSRLGRDERSIASPDDLTQEILLAVVSALPRYRRTIGPLVPFVLGIASHKIYNAYRTIRRDRSIPRSDAPEVFDIEHTVQGPEEQVTGRVGAGGMRPLLNRLPEREREVLFLRVAADLSIEQVAAVVDCSEGAVRVAQSRALAKLRDFLHPGRPARADRARRGSAEAAPAR
jgi:RNA polymerase sigma-70 factor (ECF subfamily)